MIDAESMFPSMKAPEAEATPPQPSEPPAKVPTPDEVAAERMFGQSPPAEYVFTAPKGLEHLVPDPEAHAEFSRMARDMGLSNAKAQQLLEVHLKRIHGKK